jgi:hypothetical protein
LALAFDLDVIAWTGAGLSTPSARANKTTSDLYKVLTLSKLSKSENGLKYF